jgi:arginine/lysine/ornithine decarboxylase
MIETAPVGLTGFQADDWLRDERQIDVELVDHRRIMPLITFAHGEDDIQRLVAALRELVDEQGDPGAEPDIARCPRAPSSAPSRRSCRATRSSPDSELVEPGDAPGRISAELVTPYPPGIPAIAPGEVYTKAIVEYLEEVAVAGGFMEGAADQSLSELRVVA